MTRPPEEPRGRGLDAQLRASIVCVAATGAALAVAAVPFFGLGTAFSVGMGAAIATGNLWALARIIAALLPDDAGGAGSPGREKNAAGWAVLGVLKMFGLIALVWLLMHHGIVSPLPMLVGFGALPIGIAIGSLVSHRGARSSEDDPR
jgi:hypothetical protein